MWPRIGAPWPPARPGATAVVAATAAAACAAAGAPRPTRARAITETNLGTALHDERPARGGRRALPPRARDRPDYVPAFNNLGVTLRARAAPTRPSCATATACALRGDYPDLHFNLANALLALNRPTRPPSISAWPPPANPIRPACTTTSAPRWPSRASVAALPRRSHGRVAARAGLGARASQPRQRPGRRWAATTRPSPTCARPSTLAPGDAEAHYDLGRVLPRGRPQRRGGRRRSRPPCRAARLRRGAQQPRHRARLAGPPGAGHRRSSKRRSACAARLLGPRDGRAGQRERQIDRLGEWRAVVTNTRGCITLACPPPF